MNITIKKEDISAYVDVHGGEYARSQLEITVDSSLDERIQRNLVIHAVIENFCLPWSHDKVEDLTNYISDALDQMAGIS